MATPFAKLNVFKVTNESKSSNIDNVSLKNILENKGIDADVYEDNDGWLIKIDCYATEVLSQEDYCLVGKHERKAYNLTFTTCSEKFPDQEKIESENEESEDEEDTELKTPFETLPNMGQDREPRQQFRTFDLDEETEQPTTQSEQRTILVHGVPKTVDSEELQLYFENPKSSKGGNITSFEIDKKNEIKITFESAAVARAVLEKKSHVFGNSYLSVSMYVPPQMEDKQVVISDFKHKISPDSVKNFLEAKIPTEMEIEIIKKVKPGIFLVYFAQKIDIEKLKIICKNQTKAFLSATYPKVQAVPVTTQIIVSNFDEKMTKESVKNFFHNPFSPEDIVGIKELPADRFVITFRNSDLAKKMSQLNTPQFEINLYHDCESSNETYKEISLRSPFLLNFIKDQKHLFEDQLKDYGYLDFSKSNGNLLKIMCDNDKEEQEINERVEELLTLISEEQVLIPSELFDEVKEMPVKDKNVNIYFDKGNFTAHIFSFNKTSSSNCKQNISNFIEQRFNTKEEVALETYKIILLFSDFFPTKIFPKYKKVNISLEKSKVVFCGFSTDVNIVINEMYKYLSSINITQIKLPPNSNEIFHNKEVKQYLLEKVKKKKCPCAWEINPDDQVCLYFPKKGDAEPAKEILRKSIVELNFHLNGPKSNILKEEKWKIFLKDLSKKYGGNFYIDIKNNKLAIVTTDQIATKIETELEKFFDINAVYRQNFPLRLGVYTFLMRFESVTISDFARKHPPLEIQFENDHRIQTFGTKQVNIKVSTFLKDLMAGIIEQKETFPHLGFKKFLKTDLADTILEKISKSNECIIIKNEDAATLGNTSIYQIKYANSEIILQFKDITELDVDAIVNPANKDLKHVGGLSLAIIRKGGEMIQEECNDIMKKTRHSLNEGAVKVTSAGNLRCKFIMHAVGPVWKDGNNYEAEFLSEAVTNALAEAENRNLNSIAIPAISTGTLRFPINKATEVIINNIKIYLDDNPNTKLKSIYLISLKNNIINAFRNQLNSAFPEAAKKVNSGPTEQMKPAMKSQTNIEIEFGLLNQTKCDVIVNTTNQKLNLTSGQISKALLADAGPRLQQECNRIQDLPLYDVAVTGGYNLPCKAVFHIYLPYWSESSGQVIRTDVQNCLKKADQQQHSHIAFPVFGTGILGYPSDIVANEMVGAALEYISTERTALQKISFVVYPGKKDLYQAFENAKKMGPSTSMSNVPTYQPPVINKTATPISLQGDKLEMDIKGIKLIVKKGNLVEQTTDVIVHGTNQQFSLRGAISQVLLNKIGHQFTNDCKAKVPEMKANNFALTPGHSLGTSWILHINIEGIKNSATPIFKNCFEAAESNQLTSLAVPPIGTGGLGCSVQYFCEHFMKSIHNFAKSSPKHLRTVIIVAFDQAIFADIYKEIGNKGNTSRFSLPSFGSIGASISRFAGKQEKFVSKETVPSAVNLFIYAKNMDKIRKVKAEIDSKYMKEHFQKKTISEEIIEKLPAKQKKKIDELQNEYDVKIEFRGSSINVSGYKDDVGTVIEDIHNLLLTNFKEISRAEITEKLVQWSYITTTNNKPEIVPYPSIINHKLELAYEDKQKMLKIPGNSGSINFDFSDPENMLEYKENDKANAIRVLRKDLTKSGILLPEDWDPMDNEDYLKVELKPGVEFDSVKNKFPSNFTIVKIERIQRKSLYIQYQAQLQKMNAINPKQLQNETKDLWHGTSEGVTEKINRSGFDRGYCGKNAVAFGQGVYFAKDAQYSLSNTYSPPNSKGEKHIYLCNVLTGVFCRGDSNMRVLPPYPNIQDRTYDSSVNDINNPTIFVTFHDVNAYPAYLITCK